MKKSLNFLLIALMVVIATPVQGQKFLKKISKGLDKVSKGLDDATDELNRATGKDKSVQYSNGDIYGAYKDVKVVSFNKNVDIRLESCMRNGDNVIVFYTIKNNSDNKIQLNSLGTHKTIINPDDETLIIGDDGKSYSLLYQYLGDMNSSTINRVTLLPGVQLRGMLKIKQVSPKVKQFTQIDIAGLIPTDSNGSNFTPFTFKFKDVPVYTLDQTLEMMNPKILLTKENLIVRTLGEKGMTIDKLTITDKYTRVDCTWTNNEFRPYGSIFITEVEPFIDINGKAYTLLYYDNLGAKSGLLTVNYGTSHHYTYVFEPIPATTEAFNIKTDKVEFGNVRIVEEESFIIIPHTTGVMTSLNEGYNAYHKRTRMTAANRTKYKIDKIKKDDIILSQAANANLSVGKTIYEGSEGKLQTIMYIMPDQMTVEYLVSYDAASNYVDCIQLGLIHEYGGDRGYGEIENNKIIYHSSYPVYEDEEDLEYFKEFELLPSMKFVLTKEYSKPI